MVVFDSVLLEEMPAVRDKPSLAACKAVQTAAEILRASFESHWPPPGEHHAMPAPGHHYPTLAEVPEVVQDVKTFAAVVVDLTLVLSAHRGADV